MSENQRTLEELFEQLGLSPQKIHMERYVEKHQMKLGSILEDAIFWAPDQKALLIEANSKNSEWHEARRQLSSLLVSKSNFS